MVLPPTAVTAPTQASVPLRRLVFSAQIDATAGFSSRVRGVGNGENGAPMESTGAHDVGDVVITADIMQALPDGSLVIAIAETGKRVAPSARFGVLKNAVVMVPSSSPEPTPEERGLLMLLARGLAAGRDLTTGNAWTLEDRTAAQSTIGVRVAAVNAQTVSLDLSGTVTGKTGNDSNEHLRASVEYDPDRTVPVNATLDSDTHIDGGDHYSEIALHAVYRLVSDSLPRS